jgi:uncharacterized protein Yka (UPF0111/DUF47 family)
MKSEDQILHLQAELDGVLRSLEDIKKLLSMGKSKEIYDEINTILKHYGR